MTTKIKSGTERTERRYAEVVGQMRPVAERAAYGDRYVLTLADLRGLVRAADAARVPDDTPVKTAGLFGGSTHLSRLLLDTQVVVAEEQD